MKLLLAAMLSATMAIVVSSPSVAQQKTAKACRAGPTPSTTTAPAPAPTTTAPTAAPSTQKTAKACREEWQAKKADFQKQGVTQKAYVEQCRAGNPPLAPTTTTTTPAPAPAGPPPAPTATPSTPAPAPSTAPAPKTAAPAAPPPAASTTRTGTNQFSTEAQAKAHCPSDLVVWVNLDSKIYHFSGTRNYGTTKEGAYMCEKEATSQGMRAAKNEKRPSS
jgi:hypothetical protein